MTEQNESGNRWEKPADPADGNDPNDSAADAAAEAAAVPAEAAEPSAPAATEPVRISRIPEWVTRTRLIATGAAAAIFLGGGVGGYAVGNSGHDDSPLQFPRNFARGDVGFGPGRGPMQGPGGQLPGGQQGLAPQSGSNSGSGSSS